MTHGLQATRRIAYSRADSTEHDQTYRYDFDSAIPINIYLLPQLDAVYNRLMSVALNEFPIGEEH